MTGTGESSYNPQPAVTTASARTTGNRLGLHVETEVNSYSVPLHPTQHLSPALGFGVANALLT